MNENRADRAKLNLGDVLSDIEMYEGEKDELETFINKCDFYVNFTLQEHQDLLLQVIKTRLTGNVLRKIGSIDDYPDWECLKTSLRNAIKPLIPLFVYQRALLGLKQKNKENVHEFGMRIKMLLIESYDAKEIKTCNEETVKRILRRQNGGLAMQTFKETILNDDLRRIILPKEAEFFDDLVSFAYEKELGMPQEFRRCSLCGKNRHFEFECKTKCYNCNRIGHIANNCRKN